MDDPQLDPAEHVKALRDLRRLNRWSWSAGILWSPIVKLAGETGKRPLRILDLATGGGDLPIALWKRARRSGLSLEIEACDKSPVGLEYARQEAEQNEAPIRFFEWDALAQEIPRGYDVVTTSLFLHHLGDEEARELLRRMAEGAGKLALVNDLVRSLPSYALVYLGSRLLTRSAVVHKDSLLSVRAAFTLEEVRNFAKEAGLHNAQVESKWPSRFLLTWRRC